MISFAAHRTEKLSKALVDPDRIGGLILVSEEEVDVFVEDDLLRGEIGPGFSEHHVLASGSGWVDNISKRSLLMLTQEASWIGETQPARHISTRGRQVDEGIADRDFILR